MGELEFLGYAITAIITLGAFIGVVQKLTQPINDLKVVIQELRDCISSLKSDNATQSLRMENHGKEIDSLKSRVDKVETKIDLYHNPK
jgi:transcription initiation factor IIF auxiliary subunit